MFKVLKSFTNLIHFNIFTGLKEWLDFYLDFGKPSQPFYTLLDAQAVDFFEEFCGFFWLLHKELLHSSQQCGKESQIGCALLGTLSKDGVRKLPSGF